MTRMERGSRPDLYNDPEVNDFITKIGLGDLTPDSMKSAFERIRRATDIALDRHDFTPIKRSGMAEDQGFAGYRLEAPLISPEVWARVPDGTLSYVVSVGGERFRHFRLIKDEGELRTDEELGRADYPHGVDRTVTLDELADRISSPLIADYKSFSTNPPQVNVGISLAFPHTNIVRDDGIDAILAPLDESGRLTKHWTISDWEQSKNNPSLIDRIKMRFRDAGIDTQDMRFVIVNDTEALALDTNTGNHIKPNDQIAPVYAVAGSGINHAVYLNSTDRFRGFCNLESGRISLSSTDVSDRMLTLLNRDEWHRDVTAVNEPTELEHEVGAIYIPRRIEAGIQLLREMEFSEGGRIFRSDEYAQELIRVIEANCHTRPTYLSDVLSETPPDELAEDPLIQDKVVQNLIRRALKRSGQFIGLSTAGVLSAVDDARFREGQHIILSDGAFLHEAEGVRNHAEQTARSLGFDITFTHASRVNGVAALAMSYDHLREAA